MLEYEKNEPRTALLDVIGQVRRRWRTKLVLRGVVGFLAGTAAALLLSAYALEALRTHGPFKGLYLTLRRLARCQPLHPGGLDPVPPPTEGGA